MIELQLLPCTTACGYKFHALPVHLHPTFRNLESSQTSAVRPFCKYSQSVEAVGYFRGGAPSWILDRILNATLPNNLFPLVHP